MNTDDFFLIGGGDSDELMTGDNVNDHVIKNHIETVVGRLAADKESYIFGSPIQELSYQDISSALDCSEQSIVLWYETTLDKIVGVIK